MGNHIRAEEVVYRGAVFFTHFGRSDVVDDPLRCFHRAPVTSIVVLPGKVSCVYVHNHI